MKYPSKIKKILESTSNELFVSDASIWEISIKISIGKFKFRSDPKKSIATGFDLLGASDLLIHKNHIYRLMELPYHHKDPFDRILAAQALEENLNFLTTDLIFKKYKVKM